MVETVREKIGGRCPTHRRERELHMVGERRDRSRWRPSTLGLHRPPELRLALSANAA